MLKIAWYNLNWSTKRPTKQHSIRQPHSGLFWPDFDTLPRCCNPENTVRAIERFRDTEEGSTLEKLAAKDHLLEQDDFLPFFTETINTLEDQAIGQSIENLVSRASQEELDEASKTELSALYTKRQNLRQQRSES